jgi:hypothetical protein
MTITRDRGEVINPTPERITLDDADLDGIVVSLEVDPAPSEQLGRLERFARWHGEERFWREVYTRALGGVGAVLAVAVIALFALTYRAEGGVAAFAFVVPGALLLSSFVTVPHFAWRSARRISKGLPRPSVVAYVAATVLLVLTLLVALGLAERSLQKRNESERLDERANCLMQETRQWCNRVWGKP